MKTLKTGCDAKNVLRCSPGDDFATESIDGVASDVGVADVGDELSVMCTDASPKYNISLKARRGQSRRSSN
ncbi:unnamed protein product [Heligmosomoides polygyrus]|uniref:ZP domain-containing protein n=1 Tax=Heligmosomoides polygyrus TaxID=6339 RepID=A0A183FEC7_HELPZ|nr:unnamed protein product [Heligmosomoides polygyrus]